jgi:hypothetical protein
VVVLFYATRAVDEERAGARHASSSAESGRNRKTSGAQTGNDDDGALESTGGGAASSLLPDGISDPEGAGGVGVHRAVLKNGVWFPVFSPGVALETDGTAAYARRATVPLSITTGTPLPGKTGAPFAWDFEAIGGSPPYRWTFRLGADPGGFAMDAATGLLRGLSESALSTVLEVFVTDHAGAQDSARYPMVIADEKALELVTLQLPSATVGTAYAARLEAAGGIAPYRWTVAGAEAAGLMVTSNTGELSGMPTARGTFDIQVMVTDQVRDAVTTTLTVSVAGSGPAIVTEELPDAIVGANYSAQLSGEGGAPPYTWTLSGGFGGGLSFDGATGALTGTPTSAGEFHLEALLTDQEGGTATKDLQLRVINGLDITTTSPLFPASPQSPYQITFAASGGQPPYRWRVADGSLPLDAAGRSWSLSPEGVLSGVAGSAENSFRFTIELRDDAERTFDKAFELPVRQGLIAIPSRERVGLAWRPEQIAAALGSSGTALAGVVLVRGNGSYPQTPGGGSMVYQGAGNSIVDRNLPVGETYFYTLFAYTVDGRVLPFSTAAATVLPMTLQRAQAGVAGDPFADRVVAFQPLAPGGFGSSFVPGNITGPPDGRGTFAPASAQSEVASLHARAGAGGSVVVEFTNNIVELGGGVDFTVFENVLFVGGNASQRFMEPALVWVALFEGEWFRFPIDIVPPAAGRPVNLMDPFYYNKGFAGRNGTTGSDPTNPAASGGDSFDANELAVPGLTWFRFIKIQSTGDNAMTDDFGGDPVRHNSNFNALGGDRSSGFDLDAVSAVNY